MGDLGFMSWGLNCLVMEGRVCGGREGKGKGDKVSEPEERAGLSPSLFAFSL